MPVDLWRCSRCGLEWVDGTEIIPGHCPACWRETGMEIPIIVAGRDMTVRVIREYGLREGLGDSKVRRGVAAVVLGICEHGMITSFICNDCCNASEPFDNLPTST